MAVAAAAERTERAADGCDHASLTFLGSGGSVTYLQCEDCGAVLVSQAGRAWVIS